MLLHPDPFPPIPEDTLLAASSLFGKGNIYLRLGEQINELLSQLDPVLMEGSGKRPPDANLLYAMLIAFEYAEETTDRQIVEAMRNRVDLKYALHLPMNYPKFDPGALCQFRKRLSADPLSLQAFQVLLDQLTDFGLLKKTMEQPASALQVLDEICTSNRLDRMIEAMFQALETLAVTNSEWLRQVTLPHWYQRYSRRTKMGLWPNGNGKWMALALEIGADIRYLLEKIDESQLPALTSLREVQSLRQAWEEQFEETLNQESNTKKMHWRPTSCASCTKDNNEEVQ